MREKAPLPLGGSALALSGLLAVTVYGILMLLSRFREPVGFAFYGLVWLFVVHLGLWTLFARLDARLARLWPRPEEAARRVAVYTAVGLAAGIAGFDLLYVLVRHVEVWLGAAR